MENGPRHPSPSRSSRPRAAPTSIKPLWTSPAIAATPLSPTGGGAPDNDLRAPASTGELRANEAARISRLEKLVAAQSESFEDERISKLEQLVAEQSELLQHLSQSTSAAHVAVAEDTGIATKALRSASFCVCCFRSLEATKTYVEGERLTDCSIRAFGGAAKGERRLLRTAQGGRGAQLLFRVDVAAH